MIIISIIICLHISGQWSHKQVTVTHIGQVQNIKLTSKTEEIAQHVAFDLQIKWTVTENNQTHITTTNYDDA